MRQLRRDFIFSYFLELILGTGEKFALELFYPFSGIRFYFFSRRIGSADRPVLSLCRIGRASVFEAGLCGMFFIPRGMIFIPRDFIPFEI